MSSQKIADTLPPLPSSLKPISPYIQRAEELRSKDPIMAYWCTYYAAQVGLDQKTHEPGSQDYLLALITLLEGMKKDLGANDAVDHEAAGAAYVENFALKVFALADNEDRQGKATRSTAKTFLAAANFLELLRVFEKTNDAQVNNEKVRYAKWKAIDIARAFREGRKPMPGSASENVVENTPENTSQLSASATESTSMLCNNCPSGGVSPTVDSRAPRTPPRTPPPKLKSISDGFNALPAEVLSPGSWSTVATPGLDPVDPDLTFSNLGLASAQKRWSGRDDLDDTPVKVRKSDGLVSTSAFPAPVDISSKKVHFTPSVAGGLSSTDGSPPVSPSFSHVSPPFYFSSTAQPQAIAGSSSLGRIDPTIAPLPDSPPSTLSHASLEGSPSPSAGVPRSGESLPKNERTKTNGSSRSERSDSPTSSTRISPQSSVFPLPPSNISRGHERRTSASSRTSPPQSGNIHIYPSQPPSHSPTASNSASYVSDKPSDSPGHDSTWNLGPYRLGYMPKLSPHVDPTSVSSPPLELTPSLIAKAQKHCRYAISSLEYEDAEQARKELHAALAVLGER